MSLEHQMRQILAQLELISHGATMRWNPSGRGESENPAPFGESQPLHEVWRLAWFDCGPDELAQGRCVRDAGDALDGARRRSESSAAEWDEDAWILEDGEGHSVDVVARRYNTTPTRIRKLRLAAGKDAEFGQTYVEPPARDEKARVLPLLAKGLSSRQIQVITGVSKSEVSRLRRAA